MLIISLSARLVVMEEVAGNVPGAHMRGGALVLSSCYFYHFQTVTYGSWALGQEISMGTAEETEILF